MIIDIPEYKHIRERQQIDLTDNNICTLIGGNGAGKSTLLESIFSNYIDKENNLRDEEDVYSLDHNLRCIAFSSGQNELFSEIFNNYDKNAKRYMREDSQTMRSFYFDYWWSRLLVFFATSLKPDGLVRNYLQNNNYIDCEDGQDISSHIKFGLRVRQPVITKIKQELEKEATGEYIENPLYRSLYIQYLAKLINKTVDEDYDFTDIDSVKRIVSTSIEIDSKSVIDIFGTNTDKIFTFISRATSTWLSNFSFENIEIYFKNDLEFDQLSDGEYQLLSIYSMIDLFDTENTIFLFDEVDSHLHYKNLNKLWDTLKNISGKLITTTHISESILNNNFDSIAYIENGKIELSLTAREIFKRISNITGQKKYELKIASKIENLALLDDEVDWLIFKKLAIKKIGEEVLNILDKVIPYKRSSSYNTTREIFGKGKLEFVKDFKEVNIDNIINTKNIFLICDRDLLPLTQIDVNTLSVNIDTSYNDIKSFGSTKTYLHSWRMLEIENYLLSKTMLQHYHKYDELKKQLDCVNFDALMTFDVSEDLRTYDAKNILHPLYKDGGFNEEKLNEVIDHIPKEEISEDIVKMYEFIKNEVEKNN